MPAGPENYFNLVFRRATMSGFIVLDGARPCSTGRDRARRGEIVLDWASEFPGLRKRLATLVNVSAGEFGQAARGGFADPFGLFEARPAIPPAYRRAKRRCAATISAMNTASTSIG